LQASDWRRRPGGRRPSLRCASAGLGAELAWLFAADGHNVIVVAPREDKLNALAREIKAKHKVEVCVLAEDLSRPGAAKRIADELAKRGIDVEFLVNNAGFGTVGAFAEGDLAREIEMVASQDRHTPGTDPVAAPANDRAQERSRAQPRFDCGVCARTVLAIYHASKAFVNSFTEALSVELAGTGVTATVSAYRAMMRGKPMSVAGFMNKIRIASLRLAPRGVLRGMAANLNRTT
jgi:uncharacterized protein